MASPELSGVEIFVQATLWNNNLEDFGGNCMKAAFAWGKKYLKICLKLVWRIFTNANTEYIMINIDQIWLSKIFFKYYWLPIQIVKNHELFSLGLGRSKVLILRFGPKMYTKVAFNTLSPTHHTKFNFVSRRLKLCKQLNQSRKPKFEEKNSQQNLFKSLKD